MIESVHAVLLVGSRYALQLRDNRPDIAGPGLWGLFGGTLRAGEEPVQGLVRELQEELGIRGSRQRLFCCVDGTSEFSPTPKRWWFFEVDGSDEWLNHVLSEGQAVGIFEFVEMAKIPMTPMTRRVLRRHHEMTQAALLSYKQSVLIWEGRDEDLRGLGESSRD